MEQNLRDEILRLKKERNAIILAHYYERPEVQDIADYVGDSYYLSKIGRDCSEDMIVFCGVKFMAEGAKILSPNKRVFLPNEKALCSMAAMGNPEDINECKKNNPKAKVVCYVNSSTEVKAISDVCCTSSSAEKIVNNIDSDEIIFVPDKNLGSYMAEKLPNKKIILWDGFCCFHEAMRPYHITEAKEKHGQDLVVLVHPECRKEVRDMADFIGSTGQIINFATENSALRYLVVTDVGVIHELQKRNPNKEFISLDIQCNTMKITSLEDVYTCLKELKNEIFVEEELRQKAYTALERMHELGE